MKLKERIKKNKYIRRIYFQIVFSIRSVLTIASPTLASKYFYRKTFKKKLDLKYPRTFNEKLMWLKLYWQNPIKSICADKYKVREYIVNEGLKECLNQLYGVYNKPEEIIWDNLPEKFVLKVNNTCGANIICNNKHELNEIEVKKKLKTWLKDKFYLKNAEIHYKDIPAKIICEKYLETDQGFTPIDYKIYCFNGEPKVVMLCKDRDIKDVKYYFCDLEGNVLPYDSMGEELLRKGVTHLELPECIEEMYSISRKLSKSFPFVRMDFYDYNGQAIFGEMTFTPCACLDNTLTERAEREMGEWIAINC